MTFKTNTKWAGNRKGCTLSEEHKKKISDSLKGRFVTVETRQKISRIHKGKVVSVAARLKMSSSAKARVKRLGALSYWLGKKNPNLTGSNHHNWKGGLVPINKKIRESSEYVAWRNAVLARDNYRCLGCGLVGGSWIKKLKKKVKLHADHIKPFALFPEHRLELSNGQTLCEDCHRKTKTYGKH